MSAPFDSLTFSSLRTSKHRPSRAKWRAEWCRSDERSGTRQVLDGAPPARLEWRSIGWVVVTPVVPRLRSPCDASITQRGRGQPRSRVALGFQTDR
jgi:hypothetical protein